MKTKLLVLCISVILPVALQAKVLVVKQTLGQLAAGKQILTNGDLEKVQDGQIEGIKPWDKGYVVDSVARSGKVSAKTELAAGDESHRGLTYTVTLDQKQPLPFTAELWSKARDVSGTADSNYSLYIDLTYMDGSPLWGNIAPFSIGTHDWEKRTVTIVPDKPVKEVSFHGIFRGHTGTAWFDDFAFYMLDLPSGAATFDGVPVLKQQPSATKPDDMLKGAVLGGGVSDKVVMLDNEGRWIVPSLSRPSGLFLRDVTRKSDFRQPLGTVTKGPKGYHFEATDEELGLKLTADYSGLGAGANNAVKVDGTIEDLTGQDRGVSVYCSLPMPARTWHDDMRTSRKVEDGQSYAMTTTVGCGANGKMSLYPFSCVSNGDQSACLATPLDPPRLYRFAYDATSHELFGVQDLGLSKDAKTPGKATFSFVLYRLWPGQFREALDTYYQLFPDYFKKRTTVEGNWMAFDDIGAVTNPEDFHFAFKEGTNNPDYDEAHGILTYTYVEPASYWLAMGKLPRTPEAAMKLLNEQAAQKPPQARASATLTSGIRKADGSLQMSIEDTPWCDGALFINNPDPDIPVTPELPINQAAVLWSSINSALGTTQAETAIGNWRPWEEGYAAAPGQGRNGSQAAYLSRPTIGAGQGVGQFVSVAQQQPGKLIVSAWCKAESVTGEEDRDFSLYCDLNLKDGQQSWGHSVPFTLGTHDWERKELVIDVPTPVQSISLWLLFRGNHTGKVWFDDVSVTAQGSDKNLVQNPGLEPKQVSKAVIDGTYIDSLEMAASTLDFDRRWRASDSPLVFTMNDGLPAQLLMFGTYDFIKDVSEKMHAQGKTIFANSALHRFAQPAAVLDVMGTETNWNRGEVWSPMHDADCNFKRAMCYQRPYLLLQNTVFEEMPVEKIEKYMKRSIFYGLFPSFFSHNASERTYWTRPEIYNRDRHLFKKYLPVAQAISAAGWEPVTCAATGNDSVYIERWGKGGKVYFTLFNDSDKPQQYTLKLQYKALGLKEMPKQFTDVLTGDKIQTAEALKATLEPEDLRVLAVGL
ncbi:MAG: hypothetical protein ABFE08_11925 [Armatimonadia bacterium]